MKCAACGAEIGDNKVCEYCGTHISAEMQKEQEQLNKQGCPKCGSTDIRFTRENAGEVHGKNHKQVVHHTVGYCNNCGYTWYPTSETAPVPKKRKTWLWILGWLFCFPIPLTILMLRKKEMNPIVKYGIIALAWIIYLIIGFSKNGSTNSTDASSNTSKPALVQETSDVSIEESSEKPTETVSQNEKITVSDDLLVTYLNTRDWSGTWELSDEGMFVFYPKDDLEAEFNELTAYYIQHEEIPAEMQESYNVMVNGLKSLSASVDEATGKQCVLAVANPKNPKNMLLVFRSGEVFYSAFEKEKTSFILIDGEVGEYGVEVDINKGTEAEEHEIMYYIPAGNYIVTNLTTEKNAVQVTVYSGEPIKVDEWEEFQSDDNCANPIVVMNGESKELEIKEGQFIVLSDSGSTVQFTMK